MKWVNPQIRGVPADPDALDALLRAFMFVNVRLIELRGRPFPLLYDSGVRYDREHGAEVWQTLPVLYARRRGDCEDLSAARAAELVVTGEDTGARPVVYRSGPRLWHVVVKRGNGTYEDPSKLLGMKGAA